jgi:hypothetical protein
VFNFRSNGAHIYLGTRSKMSGKACQLNRSMQHHPMRWIGNASPEEPICFGCARPEPSQSNVPADLT